MNTIWTIARREFKAYFVTPIAYVYLITFLVVVHWLFLRSFFLIGQSNLRAFFDLMPWIYLFFVPAVAMGKWAEEKKQGTIELLFTTPVSQIQVLAGKFLSGLGLLAVALFFTLPLLATVAWLGDVDQGPVIGGYLGLLFMGGAYLAIGLWVSSLTDNQIIAFILGVVACFAIFIVGEPLVTTGLPPLLSAFFQYLGLGSHFESIGRGVIDSRDVIYYLSLIALFLFFNLKSLESKKGGGALILAAIIGIFTLNLLASRHFVRLDLTQQKVFTLAPATKDILKNLEDVVTLRLYFTPDLPPALMTLRRDVEDVLSEFKTHSKNRIKVEYHNPQENMVKEQQVQMMGIPPIELNVIAKDKQELAKIYLGMAVQFAGKQEVLAVVQNTSNLEYRLAAAILKVTLPKKQVVGWWGPENIKGESYEMALERLKQRYEVRPIAENKLDQLDPKEISTLIFVVPEKLSDPQKSAFTEYVTKGGKAIILLERHSVGMGEGLKPTPKENPLEDFLKTYGVEVQQNLVLDRSAAMATFTGGIVSYHLPYPFWVQIRPEGFEKTQPMVSELSSLVLPWSAPIHILEMIPEGVSITTLFKTTKFGLKNSPNPMMPLDPQAANDAMTQGTPEVIPLGVLVNNHLLVIGNAAFLQNNFLQQFEENGVFLENAVDVFSSGDQLIGIRSKGIINEPITIVSDAVRTTIKLVDILISPLLVIGLGAFVLFWRRSRAKKLQALFSS